VIPFAVAPRLKAIASAPGSPPPAALLSAQERFDLLSVVNTLLGLAVLVAVTLL
jgi:hypothetical protein